MNTSLYDGYLLGTLTPEEGTGLKALLTNDPEAGRELVDHIVETSLLIQVGTQLETTSVAEPTVSSLTSRRRTARPRRARRLFAALAACLALTVAYLAHTQWNPSEPGKPMPIGTVLAASQGVTVLRDGLARMAQEGLALEAGDIIQTPGTGEAGLAYSGEATAIMLGPDTRIRLDARTAGKRVHLFKGDLTCDAAPQPADRPMILQTPHAEVRIMGTRFGLSVSTGTLLEVFEGEIQLTRLADGASVLVVQNQCATAAPAVPLTVTALPVPPAQAPEATWRFLLPGTVFGRGGWSHHLMDQKYEKRFGIVDGTLTASQGTLTGGAIHKVAFTQGDVEFDADMAGNCWEFLIMDRRDLFNHFTVVVNGQQRGRHHYRIEMRGLETRVFVDGHDLAQVKGVAIEDRLQRPLTRFTQFRFNATPKTALTISNLKYTAK